MTLIQFREMSTNDLAQIEAIANISFPTPWSVKTFRREIEKNEHGYYWVLTAEQRRICAEEGQTALSIQQGLDNPRKPSVVAYGGYWLLDTDVHIVTVATHPQWRQLGMAKLLLIHILVEATDAGAETISLEVRESNHAAIKLYRGLGFVEEGRRKEYYSTDKSSSEKEDALILTLNNLQSARDTFKIEHQRAQVISIATKTNLIAN